MDRDRESCVRKRAHELWREAGSPDGQDLQHWLQAERELSGRASDPLGFPDRPQPPGDAADKIHSAGWDDAHDAEPMPSKRAMHQAPVKKGF